MALGLSEVHAELPSRSLAFVPSRYLVGWALQPGRVNALPHATEGTFDTDLIDAALAQDYRVYIWPRYVNEQLQENPRYRLAESAFGVEGRKLIELHAASPEE